MSPVSPRRRLAVVVIATLSAFASMAAPALASGEAGCPPAELSNPFVPWGDLADYQLAPEGHIESTASWKLRGGASAQEGNETYFVRSPTDHRSLRIPAASSATTKRMCIGVEHTHLRFFVKRKGGSSTSRLRVEVLFDALWGEVMVPLKLVSGSGSWALSPRILTLINYAAVLSDNSIDVSFRFRNSGDAVWSVDDVYVDPWRTH